MESPMVVGFKADGQQLVCGGFRTSRSLHIFDTNRPGKEGIAVKLGKTRRSSDGQKGHVSSLAFSSETNIIAVGTYEPGSIYLYDDRMTGEAGTVLNGVCVVGHGKAHSRKKRRFNSSEGEDQNIFAAAKIKWFQSRARGGVTQMQFSPSSDYRLFSTSRRSDAILAWDIRMMSDPSASQQIGGVASYATANDTNQRIEFDVSPCGTHLYTGGKDKCMRKYHTLNGDLESTLGPLENCVNGVSYHPIHEGILAIGTGARTFPSETAYDDETKDDECGSTVISSGCMSFYAEIKQDEGIA